MNLIEVSDLTMVGESERNDFRRVTGRSAISATGSAKDPCLRLLSQSEANEREGVLEQTMVQEEKDSEIANHLQLHGVMVAPRVRRMDQDLRDESSKSGQLLNGLLLLRNRTISGVPRCGRIPQPPSHLYHPVMAVKHPPPLLLLGPYQSVAPN